MSPVGDDGDGRDGGLLGGDVDQEALAIGGNRILLLADGLAPSYDPRLK